MRITVVHESHHSVRFVVTAEGLHRARALQKFTNGLITTSSAVINRLQLRYLGAASPMR